MASEREELTDEERTRIERLFDEDGAKALRIIDDHAADRAALVAQLEAAERAHEQALNERDAAHLALEASNTLLARTQDGIGPKAPVDVSRHLERAGFVWDALRRKWRVPGVETATWTESRGKGAVMGDVSCEYANSLLAQLERAESDLAKFKALAEHATPDVGALLEQLIMAPRPMRLDAAKKVRDGITTLVVQLEAAESAKSEWQRLRNEAYALYRAEADKREAQVAELTRERDEARGEYARLQTSIDLMPADALRSELKQEKERFAAMVLEFGELKDAAERRSDAAESEVTRLTEALAAARRREDWEHQRNVAAEAENQRLTEALAAAEHPSEPSYETLRAQVEFWREACQNAEAALEAERADHDEFGQYKRAEAAEARVRVLEARVERAVDLLLGPGDSWVQSGFAALEALRG